MSEPSIAELIGWENRQDRASTSTWRATELWHRPTCRSWNHPDHCVACCGGPTVDDLLAWLQGHGLTLEEMHWDDLGVDGDGGYYVSLDDNGHHAFLNPLSYPTVIATLEAAVRSIATPTTEEPA